MVIVVDNTTRVVQLASTTMSAGEILAAAASWTNELSNYIIISDVTTPPRTYLDRCWTYSVAGVWAIVPEQLARVMDYNLPLEAGIASIGAITTKSLTVGVSQTLTASLTVTKNIVVQFTPGAIITIPDGCTLTINSPFECRAHQVFSCEGTGRVILTSCQEAYPEWWGADNTGVADCTLAFTQAGATIPLILTGTYLFTGNITLAAHLLFYGGQIKAALGATVTVYSFEIMKGHKNLTQIFIGCQQAGKPLLSTVHDIDAEPAYRPSAPIGGKSEVIKYGGAYYAVTNVAIQGTTTSQPTAGFVAIDSTHLAHSWSYSLATPDKHVYTIAPTTAPVVMDGAVVYAKYGGTFSPGWWGGGEGVVDSYPMIQHCINQASQYQATVYFGEGFGCHLRTTLMGYSNMAIRGAGRMFGATAIYIHGCEFINYQGSLVAGAYIFRSILSDFIVVGAEVKRTYGPIEMQNLINIDQCYNIDVKNIWLFDSSAQININIKSSNNITLTDTIIYTLASGNVIQYTQGINITTSTVKIINPDLEVMRIGIALNDGALVDIFSPYVERTIIALAYSHTPTGPVGQVNVYGGTLASVNGYCIQLAADNLTLYGTVLQSYAGPWLGGVGVYVYPNYVYVPKNINFYNVTGRGTANQVCAEGHRDKWGILIPPATGNNNINTTWYVDGSSDELKAINIKDGMVSFPPPLVENKGLYLMSNGVSLYWSKIVAQKTALSEAFASVDNSAPSSVLWDLYQVNPSSIDPASYVKVVANQLRINTATTNLGIADGIVTGDTYLFQSGTSLKFDIALPTKGHWSQVIVSVRGVDGPGNSLKLAWLSPDTYPNSSYCVGASTALDGTYLELRPGLSITNGVDTMRTLQIDFFDGYVIMTWDGVKIGVSPYHIPTNITLPLYRVVEFSVNSTGDGSAFTEAIFDNISITNPL